MLRRFESHIDTHFPELRSTRFLLACSGGIDSIVLWHLCDRLGLQFEVAHCNFNLRGEESDADAQFVKDLAERKNKILHIKSFDTANYCTSNKLTIQEGARALRYAWFHSLLVAHGLGFTVTAHHLDDQLETFLINLIRGSGLDGLSGIPAKTPEVMRPLLLFTREEIASYAAQNDLQWREDSSNAEDKYLRNRLRSAVLPALRGSDPRFETNFARTLRFLSGSKMLLENHISEIRARLFVREEGLTRIRTDSLLRMDPLEPYLYELFQPYGFSDWQSLERLLTADSGKELHSPTHRLLKDRDCLLLKEHTPNDAQAYQLELREGEHPGLPISLSLRQVSGIEDTGPNVLYVDKETLKKGLLLRRWRKGDYFYPLGMKGKQKVSKYFKDHKFSRYQKEAQWLLCSGDAVVWIVGHRADDRFMVSGNTTQILRIEWIDQQ